MVIPEVWVLFQQQYPNREKIQSSMLLIFIILRSLVHGRQMGNIFTQTLKNTIQVRVDSWILFMPQKQGIRNQLKMSVFDENMEINDFGFNQRKNIKDVQYNFTSINSDLKDSEILRLAHT